MKAQWMALATALVLAAGCGGEESTPETGGDRPAKERGQAQQQQQQPPARQPDDRQPPDQGSVIGRTTQDVLDLDEIDRPYRIVTEGASGDDLVLPLAIFRDTRQKLARMTAKRHLQTYRALHNDQAPPNAEVFTREILKKANLKLPALPPHQAYAYDGEEGRLVVIEYTDR